MLDMAYQCRSFYLQLSERDDPTSNALLLFLQSSRFFVAQPFVAQIQPKQPFEFDPRTRWGKKSVCMHLSTILYIPPPPLHFFMTFTKHIWFLTGLISMFKGKLPQSALSMPQLIFRKHINIQIFILACPPVTYWTYNLAQVTFVIPSDQSNNQARLKKTNAALWSLQFFAIGGGVVKSLRCIPNRKPIRLQPYPSTPRLVRDFNGFFGQWWNYIVQKWKTKTVANLRNLSNDQMFNF